jgi:hypothetical protein
MQDSLNLQAWEEGLNGSRKVGNKVYKVGNITNKYPLDKDKPSGYTFV